MTSCLCHACLQSQFHDDGRARAGSPIQGEFAKRQIDGKRVIVHSCVLARAADLPDVYVASLVRCTESWSPFMCLFCWWLSQIRDLVVVPGQHQFRHKPAAHERDSLRNVLDVALAAFLLPSTSAAVPVCSFV